MIPSLYEPFWHWAANGSVYILSDTHFDDADCRLMDPKWITPEEQVARINSVVMRNDTFVCLGDVGNPQYIGKIRAKQKILILGNHDRKKNYAGVFNEIYDGPLFVAPKILLSHEPVDGLPWCVNIHGHDHSGIEPHTEGCRHLNLATNICNYTPVSLGKLVKDGLLSDVEGIHRLTINQRAEEKKTEKIAGKASAKPKHVYRLLHHDGMVEECIEADSEPEAVGKFLAAHPMYTYLVVSSVRKIGKGE